MQLDITPRGNGVVIRVQAVPGARRNAILGVRNGVLRVAVTQVAEKGKANKALIDVLARELELRAAQVAITRGQTKSNKMVIIHSITATSLRQRINQCLESESM